MHLTAKVATVLAVPALLIGAPAVRADARQTVRPAPPPLRTVPAPPPIQVPRTRPEAPVQAAKLKSVNRIRRGLLGYAPETELFLGQSGQTLLSVIVSTDGRARDCRVERSSGYARIDEQACRVMERYARFDPALNAAGEPVEAVFRQRLGWSPEEDGSSYSHSFVGFEYPAAALEAGAEGAVRVGFKVGPAGGVSGCEVLESSGSRLLDSATCENVSKMRGSRRGPEVETNQLLIPVERVVTWELPTNDAEGQEAQ